MQRAKRVADWYKTWPLQATVQLVLAPWIALLVYELAGSYGERFWLGLFVGLLVF